MLSKLLKYDLKQIFKFLSVFYILSIVFATIARLLSLIDGSLVIDIISQIFAGAAVSMLCSSVINNIMRMWVRFVQTVYGDEGYLTHTLPVEKHQIYLAKSICGVITLVVSFTIAVIALVIAYWSDMLWETIKTFLSVFSGKTYFTVAMVLVILFLELYNTMMCGFAGIVLGYRMNGKKVGCSVLFGLAVYTATQLAILIAGFGIALFNEDVMNLFVTNNAVGGKMVSGVLIFYGIGYAVICAAVTLLGVRLIKKGVNLE